MPQLVSPLTLPYPDILIGSSRGSIEFYQQTERSHALLFLLSSPLVGFIRQLSQLLSPAQRLTPFISYSLRTCINQKQHYCHHSGLQAIACAPATDLSKSHPTLHLIVILDVRPRSDGNSNGDTAGGINSTLTATNPNWVSVYDQFLLLLLLLTTQFAIAEVKTLSKRSVGPGWRVFRLRCSTQTINV